MRLIIFILTLVVFFKTISYGIFEYKQNNNKVGGIIIYVLGLISLITPNIMISMR